MKSLFTLLIIVLSTTLFAQTKTLRINSIKELHIDSTINTAVHDYLRHNISKIRKGSDQLVLVKMNTPGGLVSTTQDIIQVIANSNTPVIIWITPEGSSATSAGAIIASSAHILIASDGTTIGAATPIQSSGDIQESDVRSKAINALTSLVSSLSKSRGRNAKAFSEMIQTAKSFDSEDALKSQVIDKIINNKRDLIKYLNKAEINFKNHKLKFEIDNSVEFNKIEMDLGQKILSVFASPQFAYILFILGAALLYFEFQAPGGMIAGAMGVVCLLLAAIGFQILPLNLGALALIALSFVLFILEAYITSYGIIALGGLISFICGSLFLYRTDDSFIDTYYSLIISASSAIVLYLFVVAKVFLSGEKYKNKYFNMSIKTGVVFKLMSSEGGVYKYQIKINGEIWNAQSKTQIEIGKKVKVTKEDKNKMTLSIKEI